MSWPSFSDPFNSKNAEMIQFTWMDRACGGVGSEWSLSRLLRLEKMGVDGVCCGLEKNGSRFNGGGSFWPWWLRSNNVEGGARGIGADLLQIQWC